MKKLEEIKIRKLVILAVIVLTVVFTIITINSKSKYILNKNTEHVQNSENFYFKSDLLDNKDIVYRCSDWEENEDYPFQFNICNYEDELRYNNLDISYEVNVILESEFEGLVTYTVYINGVETTNGELVGGEKSEDTIMIKINSTSCESVRFRVEVSSSEPYYKCLFGNIEIDHIENIEEYEVNFIQNEDNEYANLIIHTNDFSGNLEIIYNSEVTMPNMNTSLLSNKTKTLKTSPYYSITLQLEQNSNYQIEFINLDTSEELVSVNNSTLRNIVIDSNE